MAATGDWDVVAPGETRFFKTGAGASDALLVLGPHEHRHR